jgi:hypothetical protein
MEENNKNKDYEYALLERLEGKIDGLIEGQKMIEEKVEKIDLLVEDMDYVKGEIVEIKDRFKETDEELVKKAEKETVLDHEKRLVKLESTALA